jgi:hypothetical protein
LTNDASQQMARIRLLARTHGLKIRARQVSRGSSQRAYSVLDGETGESLVVAPDLDELKTRLWWVIRQREVKPPVGATGEVPREPCPRCGTPRVGALRFCRSCGLDFEPVRVSEPTTTPVTPTPVSSSPATSLPATSSPAASSLFRSTPVTSSRIMVTPIATVASAPLASSRVGSARLAAAAEPDPDPSHSSVTARAGGAVRGVARDDRFSLLRLLIAGVVIGVLVGGLVILVNIVMS